MSLCYPVSPVPLISLCSISVSLTNIAEVVARVKGDVVFPGEPPYRIGRTIVRLRTLHPVRTYLDRPLIVLRAEGMTHHTSAELVSSFDDDEVIDALLVQRPCGDDTCNAASQNEELCVLVAQSRVRREYILSLGNDGVRECALPQVRGEEESDKESIK